MNPDLSQKMRVCLARDQSWLYPSTYSPDLIHQLPAIIIFHENMGRDYHHLLNYIT